VPSELVHLASGAVLATDVWLARSVWEKTRGLIRRDLPTGAALIIEPARQIHTFGVRGPIDVVFCDGSWIVVHVRRRMRPARVSSWVRKARYVIELPGGELPEQVEVGDRLALVV